MAGFLGEVGSLVELSSRDGVENEKCVVRQHRTTLEQKNTFVEHMKTCTPNKIPVEWVIDIADESSGWFYGTAYHFDDTTKKVHVMVPDKHNPSFDGEVNLDYRTMHLIECVDGKTDALFNKIVRDSIMKIRWELKWFEEDAESSAAGGHDAAKDTENPSGDGEPKGRWIPSIGRYYIRMANQILVEDEDTGEEKEKGFVMITADIHVRLHHCSKGKGQEDFNRLVLENQTQSSPAAIEEAKTVTVSTDGNAAHESNRKGGRSSGTKEDAMPEHVRLGRASSSGGDLGPSLLRVHEASKDLKDSIADLLDEKEKERMDRLRMAKAFSQFSLDGDLDAGLLLYVKCEEIAMKEDNSRLLRSNNRDDPTNALAQETWHLSQRVEKGLSKLVKQTNADEGQTVGRDTLEEMDQLRERERKMRRELDNKEKELSAIKAMLPAD